MSGLYDVRVTFDAKEGAREIVDALLESFEAADSATVAQPASINREDDHVTVHFRDMSPDRPPAGREYG